MSLDLASLPLAWIAGVLSILSPCVWPLIPVVMSSASVSGRLGPLYLSLGLVGSFAAAGTGLTYLLMQLGVDTEWMRYAGAVVFLCISATLLIKPLGDWITALLSRYTPSIKSRQPNDSGNPAGQVMIGMTLGLVWLPCVGPTVGTAIALASMGQNMIMAFMVLLAFALGTACALLVASFGPTKLLMRFRPDIMKNAQIGKKILGVLLLGMACLTLSGFDKVLEAWV